MALIYAPINGKAGSITFSLIDRETAEVFSSATLNSFEFEEEDEESDFNETFVNINDELVKDYYGYRKRIHSALSMVFLAIAEFWVQQILAISLLLCQCLT
jgi:hypothetical protein